jgi:hypothetical protein
MRISALHRGEMYQFPPALLLAYRDELTKRSLLEYARQGSSEKDIHGGEGVNETETHFAYRFLNSASRPQHLLLGEQFADIQKLIHSTFMSGHVAILDLACGAGAGTISLLSVLAAMRRANALPSLPLNVDVVGVDFSQAGLDIFDSMTTRLGREFDAAAISVSTTTSHWDARRSELTSAVCDRLLAIDANEFVVIVNNFSGHGTQIEKELDVAWQHISDRLASSPKVTTATWVRIESNINSAKRFLGNIKKFFAKQQLQRHFPTVLEVAPCQYHWWDDIRARDAESGMSALIQRR